MRSVWQRRQHLRSSPTLTDDTSGTNVARSRAPGPAPLRHPRPVQPDRARILRDSSAFSTLVAGRDRLDRRRRGSRSPSSTRRWRAASCPGETLSRGVSGFRPAQRSTPVPTYRDRGVVRNSKSAEVSKRRAVSLPAVPPGREAGRAHVLHPAPGNDPRLASAIREQVRKLDGAPDLRRQGLRAPDQRLARHPAADHMLFFIGRLRRKLAALLAALGIYGVLAFSVASAGRRSACASRSLPEPPPCRASSSRSGAFSSSSARRSACRRLCARARPSESILYSVHASDLRDLRSRRRADGRRLFRRPPTLRPGGAAGPTPGISPEPDEEGADGFLRSTDLPLRRRTFRKSWLHRRGR